MAAPVIPLALLGVAGYAVYRGLFHVDRSHRSNARNGWTNEAFSQREKDRRRDERKGCK